MTTTNTVSDAAENKSFLPRETLLAPRYVYIMLLSVFAVALGLDWAMAHQLRFELYFFVLRLVVIYTLVTLLLVRAFGNFDECPRWVKAARLLLEGAGLFLLLRFNLPLLDHQLKAMNLPLQDSFFAQVDAAMGFDWYSYFVWVHDHPTAVWLFDLSYARMDAIAAALMVIFIVLGQLVRVRFYIECMVWTTLIAILVSAIVPAFAAPVHYGVNFAQFPNFPYAPGMYHVENLSAMREGGAELVIGEMPFKGLVTFPSLHTAIGLLLIGAAWRHWLVWPMVAYNAVMLPSVPVYGGHYLVDMLAGAALALAVMAVVALRSPSLPVFTAAKPIKR